MSMFRKRRITDDQLQSLLRSMPQAKAPADMEDKLNNLIAEQHEHVPHLLSTLPWVHAPADFDARLMEAIRESHRRVPVPVSSTADVAPFSWFNNATGWVVAAAAVIGLSLYMQPSETSLPVPFQMEQTPASVQQALPPVAPAAPVQSKSDHAVELTSPASAEPAAPVEIAPKSVRSASSIRISENPQPRRQRIVATGGVESPSSATPSVTGPVMETIPSGDGVNGSLPNSSTIPPAQKPDTETVATDNSTTSDSGSNVIVNTGKNRQTIDSLKGKP